MKTLLIFLSWKKWAIATILMGTVAYLATKDLIWEPEVVLSTIIVWTIFGWASYLTKKVIYNW